MDSCVSADPLKRACASPAVDSLRALDEQLNDALQRLRFHVERMPLAHIVWHTDFRVADWNPASEHIFGYTKAEAIGRNGADLLVPPDARPAVDKVWADLLRGDTSSHSINANVRKDGSRITCEWFNTPLRDSGGNIHCVASMAQDITDRENAAARISDAQKLESIGVLASGIAHDFNSSLMVILGNASLLRSLKGMPANAAEHLELIEQAGFRSNQLIKHLLAYARTGRHNPQPTDLNALITDSAAFLRSTLGKNHSLELGVGRGVGTIHVDRSQIEQIIVNLCLNAKQSMPNGGQIHLSTKKAELTPVDINRSILRDVKPGEYIELAVRDTGGGIAVDILPRIFDPFFTTRAEGHGLGLPAVIGILRQHNGTLIVESTVGKGSIFRVYLPRQSRSA